MNDILQITFALLLAAYLLYCVVRFVAGISHGDMYEDHISIFTGKYKYDESDFDERGDLDRL